MTEKQWQQGAGLWAMLRFIEAKASERKLRLFACACIRHVWHLLNEKSREAVEVAEQYADGLVEDAKRRRIQVAAGQVELLAPGQQDVARNAALAVSLALHADAYTAAGTCAHEVRGLGLHPRSNENKQQCADLREILSNPFHPFRPVTIDPAWRAWNDGTVVKLARAIYDERELPSGYLDAGRLAILADALEDAGCTNADILGHCRSPGPHMRGCWVVDLLLGKE